MILCLMSFYCFFPCMRVGDLTIQLGAENCSRKRFNSTVTTLNCCAKHFKNLKEKKVRVDILRFENDINSLVVRWLAHMPFTSVTQVRFLLSAVIWLKFYLGRMWEECFQFDSTKHRRFSLGTPVSSCTNTGPMRDDPYWTSRENSLVMTDRVIQCK